jgi:hypothetical protein
MASKATLAIGLIAVSFQLSAAQQVRFQFWDGRGAKIFADNRRLLVDDAGVGFYIIGSDDYTDDENNIASFSRHTRNGILRTMNGDPTPYIPYQFTLRLDPHNPRRLHFNISVGPAPFQFTTISFPLDGRLELFHFWRCEGSGLGRYDQNPYAYTPPNGGPIYVQHVRGNRRWAEMIGPNYTVRITLEYTSKPNLGVAFVNAPFLSTGVRNVEFGFGRLEIGEVATARGYIDVYRTDPSLFRQNPITFEAEAHSYHEIGRRERDGWSARVGDTPNKFLNFGPYTTEVVPGSRTAVFRLQVDNNTADNYQILYIDVYDATAGRVVASRYIRRREFSSANRWQDFRLSFVAETTRRYEFRVKWLGRAYVKLDYTRIE